MVIVGGGPVGLTLSILLSRLGVDSQLVERRAAPTAHPQAHFVNNRTREIFRPMLGLDREVARAQPPLEDWRHFIYATRMLGGVELGRVDHFDESTRDEASDEAGKTRVSEVSPTSVAHLSQHRLEPMLLARALEAHPRGEAGFSLRTECADFAQDARGVTVRTRQLAADPGDDDRERRDGSPSASPKNATSSSPRTVRGEFLVAADGAGGGLRRALGVSVTGTPAMQHLVNVHFTSPKLADALRAANRAAMLYFVFNPDVVAAVVAHDVTRDGPGEFVAQIPFFPPTQSVEEDFTITQCERTVRDLIGRPNDDFLDDVRVLAVRRWTMGATVADRFARGRVFLAGDAAHAFPPAGGFGMNTGVQDAHNLAWKLSLAVEQRRVFAVDALAASYENERRPVAVGNARVSTRNFETVLRVPAAVGLEPAAADALRVAAETAEKTLGSATNALESLMRPFTGISGWHTGESVSREAARRALAAGLALGRAQCGALLETDNAVGNARRAAVARLCASADATLRLQFPEQDLGFVYGDIGDGWSDDAPSGRVSRGVSREDSDSAGIVGDAARCVPPGTLARGARLPHARLRVTNVAGLRERDVSSLDLVECDVADGTNSCDANREKDATTKRKTKTNEGSLFDRAPTFALIVSARAARASARFRRGPDAVKRAALSAWADSVAAACPEGTRLRLALIEPEAEATTSVRDGDGRDGRDDGDDRDDRDDGAAAFADAGAASLRVAAADRDGAWARAVGARAVLARPDGHVAWIGEVGGETTELVRALRRALGRPAPT